MPAPSSAGPSRAPDPPTSPAAGPAVDPELQGPSGPPGDRKQPFFTHLVELRNRLRNAAIAYIVVFLVLLIGFGSTIVALLAVPLTKVWSQHTDVLGPMAINYANLIDPFWIEVKLSAIAALLVASPYIFLQLWRFVAPGLYQREKRAVLAIIVASVVFFVGGALFGYFFVFPVGFNFFLSYAKSAMGHMTGVFGFLSYNIGPKWQLRPMLMIDEYTSLVVKLLLVFGCVFELPLVLVILSWLGMVTARKLLKFEKWAFLLCFILGALVAPDPITQSCVALPLFGLYNLAILGAWIFGRERRQAREAASSPPVT